MYKSCFIGTYFCFERSESLEVLSSLAIEDIVEVDSRSSFILYFVDINLAENSWGKKVSCYSLLTIHRL